MKTHGSLGPPLHLTIGFLVFIFISSLLYSKIYFH